MKPFEGKRFATDSEVQQGGVLLIQTPVTMFFYAGTQSLQSQRYKFLNVATDYSDISANEDNSLRNHIR